MSAEGARDGAERGEERGGERAGSRVATPVAEAAGGEREAGGSSAGRRASNLVGDLRERSATWLAREGRARWVGGALLAALVLAGLLLPPLSLADLAGEPVILYRRASGPGGPALVGRPVPDAGASPAHFALACASGG